MKIIILRIASLSTIFSACSNSSSGKNDAAGITVQPVVTAADTTVNKTAVAESKAIFL